MSHLQHIQLPNVHKIKVCNVMAKIPTIPPIYPSMVSNLQGQNQYKLHNEHCSNTECWKLT